MTSWLKKNYLPFTIVIGSLLIVAWTLFRFWSEESTFDLIGQQLLTRLFLENGQIDATIGATHYILKMVFIYMPFESIAIDPRMSLVAMTLLVNVGSYIAILFAIRSIAQFFNVFNVKFFIIGMLWLASTAGSVFWIEFTNSRNVEVALGLLVVVLGLHFWANPSKQLGGILLAVATFTFFADPLQIYMTGLPLIIYVVCEEAINYFKHRQPPHRRRLVVIILLVIMASIAAKVLLVLVTTATSLRVVSDSTAINNISTLSTELPNAVKGLIKANIRIFAGYLEDGGRLRQLLSVVSLAVAGAVWGYFTVRRKIPWKAVCFILVFMICIQAIYFLSGQSSNGDTSRYLIMGAPIFVLLIISLPNITTAKVATILLLSTITINIAFVSVVLPSSFISRFSADQSLYQLAEYSKDQAPERVQLYASMDTALTTDYYYKHATILPLECTSVGLKRARNFYPNSTFDMQQSKNSPLLGIVLDKGSSIINHPFVCNEAGIVQQLGTPTYIDSSHGGLRVLYYRQDVTKIAF